MIKIFPGSSAWKESTCNAGPWFNSWVGKILWRRDRLPTSVFLDFSGGSDGGKESACNVGDLDSIPGFGRSPGEGKQLPTQVILPGEFHRQWNLASYSPWSYEDLDTTERLLLHFLDDKRLTQIMLEENFNMNPNRMNAFWGNFLHYKVTWNVSPLLHSCLENPVDSEAW